MQQENATPNPVAAGQDGAENFAEAEAPAPTANGAEGASAADTQAQDPLAALQAQLVQEQARYSELLDRYQRAGAEFQNSRRRLEKQMADAIASASTHVIRRLLPVLDDCELAFRNLPPGVSEDQAAWVEGFRAIYKKLLTVLEEEGVRPMPETGPFDPTRHEAVSSEPNDSVESGHIIATLRTGYELNGAVVRPALVRVAQ